eukprot:1510415-Amphidinium_carterae.1
MGPISQNVPQHPQCLHGGHHGRQQKVGHSHCVHRHSDKLDDAKSLNDKFPVAPQEGDDNYEEYVDMKMNIRGMKDDIVLNMLRLFAQSCDTRHFTKQY